MMGQGGFTSPVGHGAWEAVGTISGACGGELCPGGVPTPGKQCLEPWETSWGCPPGCLRRRGAVVSAPASSVGNGVSVLV